MKKWTTLAVQAKQIYDNFISTLNSQFDAVKSITDKKTFAEKTTGLHHKLFFELQRGDIFISPEDYFLTNKNPFSDGIGIISSNETIEDEDA